MKNILITGGAGFIGSHLALALLSKGYDVTILDSLNSQIHGINPVETSPLFRSICNKVNFIHGCITDRNKLQVALKGQDVVIHLAAETGTGQSMYDIEKYSHTNVCGTSLLLDILTNTKNTIKKIIVASSRSIYGEGRYYCEELGEVYPMARLEEDMLIGDFECKYPGCDSYLKLMPTDEASKIHPTSVYGITKQVQEQLIMTVCPTIGIAPVALRYQNVYGPGQSLSNPYTGILSIFSTRIKNGNKIEIFEDGKESRDFVYINDVVKATILSLESDKSSNNVFNVGSGVATNVLHIAETLREKYKINVPIEITGKFRLGDIRHNIADLTKIKNLLNYNPEWTFEKGISEFIKWVNNQEIQEDKYELSIKEMASKGLYK